MNSVLSKLSAVDPTFKTMADDFLKKWKGKGEGIPFFLLMGTYAEQLVFMVDDKKFEELKPIMGAIEELYTNHYDESYPLLTPGLLTSIRKNFAKHRMDSTEFVQLLSPVTLSNWASLTKYDKELETMKIKTSSRTKPVLLTLFFLGGVALLCYIVITLLMEVSY